MVSTKNHEMRMHTHSEIRIPIENGIAHPDYMDETIRRSPLEQDFLPFSPYRATPSSVLICLEVIASIHAPARDQA